MFWVITGLTYRPLIYLATKSGVRISEIRALPRQNIDFEKRSILVDRTADEKGRIKEPKTQKSNRTVYVPRIVADVLRSYMKSHDREIVFSNSKSNPESLTNLKKRCWAVVLEKAKVEHFGIHGLRHFYASQLVAGGENLKEIQEALGHAQVELTLNVYGHLFDEDNVKRAEMVEEIFG